ncbi:MAG: transketolase [Spirochaetia bacterium]|nr:transketolase [Spirochaetia bacterium]
MEIVTRPHGRNLIEWARDKPRVVVLSADLTGSCEVDTFRDTYPSRFISAGIAEQNMMSVSAGMAREGFIPFVHTFAVFIYRRAYDQVAMSIAYSNLPVKMFGFLPGVMTPGGATHQALEDIAIMRSLPNMTVIDTADATEIETMLDPIMAVDGPVYVRMLRGDVPRLFDKKEPFELSVNRTLSTGSDIMVVSCGICTEESIRAVAALRSRGVSVGHIHVSTLKPFNAADILEAVSASKYGVITVENHTTIGGLGTIVSEAMAENGMAKKIEKLGLQDKFAHGASKRCLMKEYGFDAPSIVAAFEKLSGSMTGISEEELKAVEIKPVHSPLKAEDL